MSNINDWVRKVIRACGLSPKAKDVFRDWESICFGCGARIYKPMRELSDEEIRKTIVKEMGEFYQNNQDAFELCKSILKKAREQ